MIIKEKERQLLHENGLMLQPLAGAQEQANGGQ